MIRIALVDDQEMIRAGLSTILGADSELEVVGQFASAEDLLAGIASVNPDVLLMDIRMPGLDGVSATKVLREKYSSARLKIVILTTFEEDSSIAQALQNGADGFLGKGIGPQQLVETVKNVASGAGALSPAAAALAISSFRSAAAQQPDPLLAEAFSQLTGREKDVVEYVKEGLNNEEIARMLFISPHTVKTHLKSIMAKVNAHDRAQLVAFAYRARG